MKQIDLDQKQFDLESIIFAEYFKRWELGLTLAFITESDFCQFSWNRTIILTAVKDHLNPYITT